MDKDTRLPADGKYDDGKVYEKGVLIDDQPDIGFVPKDKIEVTGIDDEGNPITEVIETQKNPDGSTSIPYLLHIYYDFDQAAIRSDAMPELEKLQKLLHDNPQYIIEIGSHTHARGSYHYNNRLSQRRADSVVKWLILRGIE